MFNTEEKKRAEELAKILTIEEQNLLGTALEHNLTAWDVEELGKLKDFGRNDLMVLCQDFLVFLQNQGLDTEDYHQQLMMLIMELAKTCKESKSLQEKYASQPSQLIAMGREGEA